MDLFYPLQWFADFVVYGLLGLARGGALADSANFAVYDVLKIFVLLGAMMYAVSYARTYASPERVRRTLGGKSGLLFNLLAALLGVLSPFCSCSSIPLFIGFLQAGVPLGVTFSFLITSPLVDAAAVAVLLGSFGLDATLLYVSFGVLIGTLAGYSLGLLKLESLVEGIPGFKANKNKEAGMKRGERAAFAWRETKDIFKRVWVYVVIGVSIGALFHGYAPEGLLAEYANNWLAVPIATLVGVPLYSNVIGMIPIAQSLVTKGLPIGTALAFLMSVTALSLPQIVILQRVLKPKLLALFVGIVWASIILVGYALNALL
jgi:uncharacterized protein